MGRIYSEDRVGVVVKNLPRSILFFDDESGETIFIPKSIMNDYGFRLISGFDSSATPDDLERDDDIIASIPTWLLKKEGLV